MLLLCIQIRGEKDNHLLAQGGQMKTIDDGSINRPFRDLKALLKKKRRASLKAHRQGAKNGKQHDRSPKAALALAYKSRGQLSEEALFKEAMMDVVPINKDRQPTIAQPPAAKPLAASHDDRATMNQLRKLVDHGEGFVIADTPEYVEGTGYAVNPRIAQRLHQGDYSIQDHLDLHGYTVDAAVGALEEFVKNAVLNGKRVLLIVHGRGLSSPRQPVLKKSVCQWLVRGPWRKWLMAFCSARGHDGGTGATYVLLREKPLSRSQRRRGKDQSGQRA